MEEKPTFILVVAAVIRDADGSILLQQGLPGKPHAGLWEFPGGKVDHGETPRNALVREMNEELGIALDPAALTPLGFAQEPAQGMRQPLVLILYRCGAWAGEPTGREGQEWGWFDSARAADLPMPPMDQALFSRLRNDGFA